MGRHRTPRSTPGGLVDYTPGIMRFAFLAAFLALGLSACKDGGSDRCVSSSDCKDGQGCYLLPTGAQRCLARCDATSQILCMDGTLCVSVPGEDAADDVCLPGGTIPVGAACTASADCVKGAMCFDVAGSATCRRACDITAAACQSNESCFSIDPDAGVTRGYCAIP